MENRESGQLKDTTEGIWHKLNRFSFAAMSAILNVLRMETMAVDISTEIVKRPRGGLALSGAKARIFAPSAKARKSKRQRGREWVKQR